MCIALTFSQWVSAESVPLMASLSVELAEGASLPLGNNIQVTVMSNDNVALSKALAEWQGIDVLDAARDGLVLTLTQQPTFTGKAEAAYLADSFVIDINEPSTRQFAGGFMTWASQHWQLSDLTRYVNQYIEKPNYINGFNFASVVATERSGDCTEYAALTTALARSIGIPARLIIGSVIVEESTGLYAFGHAWTEVYYNERWQIIDAALLKSTAVRHFYLPASALKNEGPGYAMALVNAVGLMPEKLIDVKRVR